MDGYIMAYDDLPIEEPVVPTPPNPPPVVEMETRDILNNSGVVIGQLSFPVGTSENIWATRLAEYAALFVNPTQADAIGTVVLTGSSLVTTSSSQPSLVAGMSVKPKAGSYLVFFNGSASTNGANASGSFALYLNGTIIPETKRDISCQLQLLGGLVSISLNTIAVGTYSGGKVTVNGSDLLELKYLSSNSGTIGFSDRTMMLIKVA